MISSYAQLVIMWHVRQTPQRSDNGGRIESDYQLATDTAVVGVRVSRR
jgi:hypothetical protein